MIGGPKNQAGWVVVMRSSFPIPSPVVVQSASNFSMRWTMIWSVCSVLLSTEGEFDEECASEPCDALEQDVFPCQFDDAEDVERDDGECCHCEEDCHEGSLLHCLECVSWGGVARTCAYVRPRAGGLLGGGGCPFLFTSLLFWIQ